MVVDAEMVDWMRLMVVAGEMVDWMRLMVDAAILH